MNAQLPIDTSSRAAPAGAVSQHDVALFDVDHFGLVIVGRGHHTDLACQLVMESGRDWRPLNQLERRFLDSLPGRSRASAISVVRERR